MDEFEIFGVLYLLGQHAVMEKIVKSSNEENLLKKKGRVSQWGKYLFTLIVTTTKNIVGAV
jgi:hypothetical protein